MPKVHTLSQPGESLMLDYVVNIYQDGKFVTAFRYEGYSGNAVYDEVKYLQSVTYPPSAGYTIEW